MRTLAIDQGTSATKAVVVESDGSPGVIVEVPIRVRPGADGAVELDPEELWASVVAAGTSALRQAGGSVDAVGLANQGETVLAWDRATGAPRSAGIVWQDRRAASVCDRLAGDWSDRLAAISGLELDPYFTAPKVAWLREQIGPGPVITATDTWLLHRLCGAFVTDASTASRWSTLDLDQVAWSPEACGAFGLDPDDLPEVVANTSTIGSTGAFGSTGPEIPITGVCVDQQAALFAESCHSAGEAKCTYGTGAFLLASTGSRPTRSTHGLVGCVAWQLAPGSSERTTWCLDGQVFTVGSAVSWLQTLGVIDGPADLDRLAADASTGGAVFIPGLAGLAAPFWKPHARGAFTGLGLATGRAELVRAVLEGIAASVAFLARAAAADLGAPLTRLRVDGGLTRSTALLQIQADLLQVPVEVYPSPHATALGVAAFARIGAGAALDPAAAVGAWSPVAVVEPQCSGDEAEHCLATWRRAAEATQDL